MKIDGREISSQILNDLRKRVEKLKEKNVIPHLYIILLSDDISSQSYVKQKMLKGEQIGVKITVDRQSFGENQKKLLEKIERLNNDEFVHGIIVQRPMPKTFDEEKIVKAISLLKDVDGFNSNSRFKVPVGLAVLKLLKTAHPDNFDYWLKQQKITVLGKGLTAGTPIINTLITAGIKPEVITSNTKNKEEILKKSDVVVSAVGKPDAINSSSLKMNVILIGVGIHKEEDGKFHGDFNEEKIQNIASSYTPTPGGVGPVNVSFLMKNLVEAFENQNPGTQFINLV